MQINEFSALFKPKSIAIMGASNNVQTFGTMHLLNLINGGYRGDIYPIHPTKKNIFGLKAFQNIKDTPQAADLCLIVLPTKIVVEKLEECGKAGVRSAIIVSAGFKEVGNFDEEKKLQEVANRYNMKVVGVNCIGEVIPSQNIFMSPMPIYPKSGNVSLISQSGSYAVHPLISHQDIKYSKIISLGNESCLDIVDFLEFCGEDPETEVIGLYIEGIRRSKEFLKVAKKITPNKPILALVIGSTEAGMRGANSHTGAIAGRTEIMNSILRQAGIIQVETGVELLHSLMCFGNQPLPKGDRFAVLTVGGGPGTVFADLLEKYGLKVPKLSDELQEKLKNILPHTAGFSNPVDLTFDRDWSNLYRKVPKILFKSNEIDGILLYGIFGIEFFNKVLDNNNNFQDLSSLNIREEMMQTYKQIVMNDIKALIKLGSKYEKPIIGSSVFRRNEDFIIKFCQDNGFPVFILEEAIKPIVNMVKYSKWKKMYS